MRALGVIEYHNNGLVVRLGPAPIPPAVKEKDESKPAVNKAVEDLKMLARSSSFNPWGK